MNRSRYSICASVLAGFILFHIVAGSVETYPDKLACEQARDLVDLNERRYACIPNRYEIDRRRNEGKLDFPKES